MALELARLYSRPGELQRAEWAHIDFEAAEWRIPPRVMKLPDQHIVPLSRQTLDILRALHARPIRFSVPRQCRPSDEREHAQKALRILGYNGDEMTGPPIPAHRLAPP